MAEQQLGSVEAVESYFTLVRITNKVRGTTHLYPHHMEPTLVEFCRENQQGNCAVDRIQARREL